VIGWTHVTRPQFFQSRLSHGGGGGGYKAGSTLFLPLRMFREERGGAAVLEGYLSVLR